MWGRVRSLGAEKCPNMGRWGADECPNMGALRSICRTAAEARQLSLPTYTLTGETWLEMDDARKDGLILYASVR